VIHLISFYQQFAAVLEQETGASDTLIHVHAGMLVLLLARVVTGRSLGTVIPLSIVIVAAVGNEVLDYVYQGRLYERDAFFDLLNTVFWPFVLMIGIKARRRKPDGREAV